MKSDIIKSVKYWKYITITIVASVLGFTLCSYLSNGPYIAKSISFYANGDYIEVDARGVLNLTNSQNATLRQVFLLQTIEGLNDKIVMIEGLGNKKAIVFDRPKILDVVSKNNQQVIVKDNMWTITIQKDTVIFLDKDGKSGELVSDFLGK